MQKLSAAPAATRSSGRYCWNPGTIGPHSSKLLRLVTRTTRSARGSLTNTVTLNGTGVPTRKANDRVNVPGAAARGGGVTG